MSRGKSRRLRRRPPLKGWLRSRLPYDTGKNLGWDVECPGHRERESGMRKVKKLVVAVFVASGLLFAGSGLLTARADAPQTKCPVMAGKIDEKIYADYKGKRVFFCCKDCQEKFKADPEKYMKKLESEGVTLRPAQ